MVMGMHSSNFAGVHFLVMSKTVASNGTYVGLFEPAMPCSNKRGSGRPLVVAILAAART